MAPYEPQQPSPLNTCEQLPIYIQGANSRILSTNTGRKGLTRRGYLHDTFHSFSTDNICTHLSAYDTNKMPTNSETSKSTTKDASLPCIWCDNKKIRQEFDRGSVRNVLNIKNLNVL